MSFLSTRIANFSLFLFFYCPMCDDESFYLEEVETSDWYNISSQNFLFIDYAEYESHDSVCKLENMEEFWDEKQKQNPSNLDSGFYSAAE